MTDDARQDMLSPELFAKIKSIQILTKKLVTASFAGEYESAFKGTGMEFDEVREYQPGDDVRKIDWNVTARMSAPFVKVHKEERELTVILMVDLSESGHFGSVDTYKRERAAEAAAILAYTAIKSNDRVGLLLFTDKVERYIPPKKGAGHVWRLISEVLRFEATGTGTSVKGALSALGKIAKRRAVVFLISDFIDDGFEHDLRISARRHDLIALPVRDPREFILPDVGLVALRDAESGREVTIDTHMASVRTAYTKQARARVDKLSEMFRRAGVFEVPLSSETSSVEPIVGFLRERGGRA
jgi:uncharacterized protein (DUF58 family)